MTQSRQFRLTLATSVGCLFLRTGKSAPTWNWVAAHYRETFMNRAIFGLAAILAAGSAGACFADNLLADPKFTETTLGFDVKGRYSNFTFTVTGPAGFSTREFSRTSAPSLDIRKFNDLPDGVYIYQLSAATDEKIRTYTPPDNNGREGRPAGTMLKAAS